MKQLPIKATETPNFIGAWQLDDLELCDEIIALFEANEALQQEGGTGLGSVDKKIKNSTDLIIEPKDLERADYAPLTNFMDKLHSCYVAYTNKWDIIPTFMPRIHIGRFNIQRYTSGGHFNKLHSERMSFSTMHRLLVWMTYLNDVTDGGETEFPYYGLKIKPEKGKTLIWPAEWTHAHRGCPVGSGAKYIVTGWMHFPGD